MARTNIASFHDRHWSNHGFEVPVREVWCPSVVLTDNGPCYSSAEFQKSSEDWSFQHVTCYPQSNCQSGRIAQTLKAMLEKAEDPYKALLSYQNTTLEEVNLSPTEMLMSRRLRTSKLLTEDILKPQLYVPEEVVPMLEERQRRQKLQHDRTAKELPPLRDGDVVGVKKGNKWKPAKVTQVLSWPGSYKVQTESGEYRRNRRHLLRTGETQTPEVTATPEVPADEDLTEFEVEPTWNTAS